MRGQTAVVTVVSQQTGYCVRQALRGSRRGGLVTVDDSARFVHAVPYQIDYHIRRASSTSQTRQSQHLPFVREVQPPS